MLMALKAQQWGLAINRMTLSKTEDNPSGKSMPECSFQVGPGNP